MPPVFLTVHANRIFKERMKMRLVIIGGGNMGGAILLALVKAEAVSPENILLIEPDKEKRDKELAKKKKEQKIN